MNDLYYTPGWMRKAAEERWAFEQGEAIAKAERERLKEREDYHRKRLEERKRSHELIQYAEESVRKKAEEVRQQRKQIIQQTESVFEVIEALRTFEASRKMPPKKKVRKATIYRKSTRRKIAKPKPDTSWVTKPRLNKKQWELWGKELLHLIRKSNLFTVQSPSFTVNQHEIDAAERRPGYRQDARDKVWDGYRWECI